MTIESSGKENLITHETGAKQEDKTGRELPALISPIFIRGIAQHMADNAARHGARNWEKGLKVEDRLNSLERHILDFKEGKDNEPHLVAAACNLMIMIHTKEMIRRGLLPEELDYTPDYQSYSEYHDDYPVKKVCGIDDDHIDGQIGDLVQVVEDDSEHKGKRGIIIQVDDDELPYKVIFEDGDMEWFDDNTIVLVERIL